MTYKETLFFVAKCLTVSLEEKNRKEIENQLKTTKIDWDAVVKLSTSHYVFPALYCNFKRVDFLKYIPEELVNYMEHITTLNRERNAQIITQAKEINQLLLENNITPIFLKGTGNLLEGLYDDIAERMVGDIDFIVSNKNFKKTVQKLKEDTYTEFHKNKPDSTLSDKHYPKMVKDNRIASIEVHYKMVINKLFNDFNYDFIAQNIQLNDKCFSLSNSDNLIMTSINKHVNDFGYKYKNFSLRTCYDLFLLSKKTSTKNAIGKIKNKEILNDFLYSTFKILNEPKSIDFWSNDKSKKFYKKQLELLRNPNSLKYKLIRSWQPLSNLFFIIYKSIFNKEYRYWLFRKITDKTWQQEKLIQLGIKKPKLNS